MTTKPSPEDRDAMSARLLPARGDRDVSEPPGRNSVVLLKDGSVARRNTDREIVHHLSGPWNHYPVQPLPRHLQDRGIADPGWAVGWDALLKIGIERVLHVAQPRTSPDA